MRIINRSYLNDWHAALLKWENHSIRWNNSECTLKEYWEYWCHSKSPSQAAYFPDPASLHLEEPKKPWYHWFHDDRSQKMQTKQSIQRFLDFKAAYEAEIVSIPAIPDESELPLAAVSEPEITETTKATFSAKPFYEQWFSFIKLHFGTPKALKASSKASDPELNHHFKEHLKNWVERLFYLHQTNLEQLYRNHSLTAEQCQSKVKSLHQQRYHNFIDYVGGALKRQKVIEPMIQKLGTELFESYFLPQEKILQEWSAKTIGFDINYPHHAVARQQYSLENMQHFTYDQTLNFASHSDSDNQKSFPSKWWSHLWLKVSKIFSPSTSKNLERKTLETQIQAEEYKQQEAVILKRQQVVLETSQAVQFGFKRTDRADYVQHYPKTIEDIKTEGIKSIFMYKKQLMDSSKSLYQSNLSYLKDTIYKHALNSIPTDYYCEKINSYNKFHKFQLNAANIFLKESEYHYRQSLEEVVKKMKEMFLKNDNPNANIDSPPLPTEDADYKREQENFHLFQKLCISKFKENTQSGVAELAESIIDDKYFYILSRFDRCLKRMESFSYYPPSYCPPKEDDEIISHQSQVTVRNFPLLENHPTQFQDKATNKTRKYEICELNKSEQAAKKGRFM